jgi:acyl-CoA thioester hydrolase
MREVNMALTATARIRIPFQDCDPMGVTWHGNYFRYLETARSDLLDKIGYNYKEMAESGFLWPIIDTRVRFVKPSRYGQEIEVSAMLVEYENRMKIDYLVRDASSGERILKGYTVQVAVDMQLGEMCFCSPDALISKVVVCAG